MANILIDGYNLIGTSHKNFEKARNDLIQRLSKYSNLKGHDITLVFDGWKNGQGVETKMRIGGVNIIYSRLGENADFVIKKILSKSTKAWIVVSSDREIADFADKNNQSPVTVSEFEGKLHSILYMTDGGETEESLKYDEDIDLRPSRQKGNPWKLSKKQKKKLQALKKL